MQLLFLVLEISVDSPEKKIKKNNWLSIEASFMNVYRLLKIKWEKKWTNNRKKPLRFITCYNFGLWLSLILDYDCHLFWLMIVTDFGLWLSLILAYDFHLFWLTIFTYFGLRFSLILAYDCHLFWLIIVTYFGLRFSLILAYGCQVFWLMILILCDSITNILYPRQ